MARKKKVSKDIIEQYSEMEDFGFSAGPSQDQLETTTKNAQYYASLSEKLEDKLEKAERLIMPLLSNLLKTADESDTIYWPNRKELLEDKIEELLEITRGEE